MLLTTTMIGLAGFGIGGALASIYSYVSIRRTTKEMKKQAEGIKKYNEELHEFDQFIARQNSVLSCVDILLDEAATECERMKARDEFCELTGTDPKDMPITLEEGEAYFNE